MRKEGVKRGVTARAMEKKKGEKKIGNHVVTAREAAECYPGAEHLVQSVPICD
jgi:hypothetical protein